MTRRYPNWCFTLHADKEGILPELTIEKELTQYYIYQIEKCPETLRLHYQGYIELKEKMSMKCLKKKVFKNDKIHLEARLGTQQQAIDYCSKEDSRVSEPVEWGTKKKQGKRSDLDTMVYAIENGSTAREILLEFRGNALRHMGMISRALRVFHNRDRMDQLILETRNEKTECKILKDIAQLEKEDAEFNAPTDFHFV